MCKQWIEQHECLPKPGFQNVQLRNRLRFNLDLFILAAFAVLLFVIAGTGFTDSFSSRHCTGMYLNTEPNRAGEYGKSQEKDKATSHNANVRKM